MLSLMDPDPSTATQPNSPASGHRARTSPSAAAMNHGAVSAEVVTAMAAGALAHSTAQLSVAISGIAGPLGGTPEKPVGTVWMGWARSGGEEPIRTRCFQFAGDRHQVREQAIVMALQGMCEFIQ